VSPTMMRMPALAVVGADHRIVRSTEAFRRRYQGAQALCEDSPEIDLVLTGRADNAVVNLGELSVAVEAVTDAAGRRQAMLSLPTEEQPSAPEPPVNALRDAAEESPAIVWVKDLEGRYLYANPRFLRDLETSEETLLGKTDADVRPGETVDGPRLAYAEDGLQEPLQLEYTVPMFEGRPALSALRFALRDKTGQPIGTCGVAAPISEAQVAREEAVRLMQLERWNRLDPVEVRAEVLEQWHVQAAPARPEDDRVEAGRVDAAIDVEAELQSLADPTPRPGEDGVSAPAQERSLGREPDLAGEPANEDPHAAAPVPLVPAPDPAPPAADAAADVRGSASEAARLQSDLQLARKWADRADQLQADLQLAQAELQHAQARILEVEADAQQSLAAAARAVEEANRLRSDLAQSRTELERAQAEAHAARSEVEVARGELGAARAQTEALRGPSGAALRLSEELGRALAAERERGDELARTLARVRARLTDLESAFELGQPGQPAPFS
jgi:PAS domain-containing protein